MKLFLLIVLIVSSFVTSDTSFFKFATIAMFIAIADVDFSIRRLHRKLEIIELVGETK